MATLVTIAALKDRAGSYVTPGIEIDYEEDVIDLEAKAMAFGKAVCITWSSGDQSGFWGPQGVQFKPHWYNMGRPAKGADKLVVMPVRVTGQQRVKFRGLPDGPDRLRAWLDRIR